MEKLLGALYQAPRCSTLHGVLREHVDMSAKADAVRRSGSGVFATTAPGVSDSKVEVWVDSGGRSRLDRDGSVLVTSGHEVVNYVPGWGAIRQDRSEPRSVGTPDLWWRPRRLLGVLDIDTVSTASALGRSCWNLTATCLPGCDAGLLLAVSGDRVELSVDQATGVVLRMRDSFDDVEIATMEWVVFEPDIPIGAEVFDRAIPDHVPIRTPLDTLIEQAHTEGVDLTGVDLTDEAALLRRVSSTRHSTESMLDQFVATGPPPDDPDTAETAIRNAYRSFAERDGETLPFIEAGHGLAAVIDEASARHPGIEATMRARRVKFLTPDRAAVVYDIVTPNGTPILGQAIGEAVLRHGHWQVARSTLAHLMQLAGVTLPPP